MNITQYLSIEKKEINRRIVFHIKNVKKQFQNVSRVNNDSFDKLQLFSIGGKGVRGGLFIATAELFGFTNRKILLDIAATVEILHAALLIHDDIMDNDQTRRGNTSLYAEYIPVGKSIGSENSVDFGKSMGICMGDISFFIGLSIFQKTLQNSKIEQKDELYKIIFQELITVCLGQMDDISFGHSTKIPDIQNIISMYTFKTAHYTFSLPFVLAATLTNRSQKIKNSLEKIGVNIGILFQIKDDEIGLFSTQKTIGKPIGSDIRENKKTILRSFLENKINKNEKNDIEAITKKSKLSSQDIQIVLSLYEKYNAKEFIKKTIKNYYENTLASIQTLSVSEEHKKSFLHLTDYVVERTS